MTASIAELDARFVWHPFTQQQTAPAPLEIVRGEREWLYTADGRALVDLTASWWVNIHGHAHPHIAAAISRQASELEHVLFAGCTHGPAARLAGQLVARAPAGLARVFYSDNGSTSVEVAIKMALQYWQSCGMARRGRLIAFEGGYHGDTVGCMSVGAASGFYDRFRKILFPVDFVPFPETDLTGVGVVEREAASLAAIRALAAAGPADEAIAAILIEPLVQGAAGMRMCRPEFLRALRGLADELGCLLIFDEVMTGFGRTGQFLAAQRACVRPDLLCLSKGITGGFMPLAATVVSGQIYEAFLGTGLDAAFLHGHSYTANPLACAAALASLELFELEGTLQRVAELEAYYLAQAAGLGGCENVKSVRVLGGIFALEFCAADGGYRSQLGGWLRERFLAAGLLVRPLGNTLYFMPPFCISRANLDRAFETLQGCLAG